MTDAIAIPGYSIVRELGHGGMAAVYLAIQQSFEREVALKIMSPLLNSDPSFTTRFMREARIVAHIHHASIVPVFDVGEHQPHHYLSMEYLPGGDLKQRITQGRIDPERAVDVCIAVCAALDLAHRKGFVHRDVKPENILFREDGTPVLTDFGIARAIDRGTSLTVTGMFVGTPNYMSPEQIKGQELDGRSDLYCLGVVFYEMLTGAVPFRADSTLSVALKHLTEPLPKLPPELAMYQAFLDRLTAKERDARFATGADVVHALRHMNEMQAASSQTLIRSRHEIELPAHTLAASADAVATPAWQWPRINLPQVNWSALYSSGRQRLGEPWSWLQQFSVDQGRLAWVGVAVAVVLLGTVAYMLGGSDRSAAPENKVAVVQAPAAPARAEPAAVTQAPADAAIAPVSTPATESAPTSMPVEQDVAASEEALPPPTDASAETPATPEDLAFKVRVAELIERNKRQAEQRRVREAKALAQQEKQQEQARDLLAKARNEYAAGALIEPPEANAAEHYRAVLKLQPQNSEASAGLARIGEVLVAETRHAEAVGDAAAAKRFLELLRSVQPKHPLLEELQSGIRQVESAPVALTRRQQVNLEKAVRSIAKAHELLARTPLDLRAADAATDQYDAAAEIAPMAPGLPSLKERLMTAYVVAAQTEVDAKETKRALKVIGLARGHSWSSPELDQLEQQIKTN